MSKPSKHNSHLSNEMDENEANFNLKCKLGMSEDADSLNDHSLGYADSLNDHSIGDADTFSDDFSGSKQKIELDMCDSFLDDSDLLVTGREESLVPITQNASAISSEIIVTDENAYSECSEPLSSCSDVIHESDDSSTGDEYNESLSTALKFFSPSKKNTKSLNGVIEEQNFLKSGLNKLAREKKINEIIHALENNDIEALKMAAISPGGLLNDNIRRKVWPKLIGVDLVEASPRPCQKEIEEHPYYQQVVLDVNRSLKRFPPSIEEAQRLTMLDQLVILIMRVLCKHPELHYYQGYHDICVTFLLVLGEETAYHVVEKLSQTHLSVFMEKSMERTIHLLEYMFLLIGKKQPKFELFLMKSEVGVAYCLSWLITWFSHVLNDYSTVVRFFDFFIVSHSWMPMYVTSSLVLHRQPEVMKQDCDMASVHSFLSKIPDDMPFEQLLTDSLDLFQCYKPKSLAKEKPYVKKVMPKPKKVKKWEFMPKLKYVPTTLVIAAAVLVTAVIYQAFNY